MKFIRTLRILFLIMFAWGFISCATTTSSPVDKLPKVGNPTYESYNIQGERGYKVTFEYDTKKTKPQEVILFGIRQKIPASAFKGNTVTLNMIHQTQALENHTIQGSELPNGILYEIDNVKYLKKVTFKSNKN